MLKLPVFCAITIATSFLLGAGLEARAATTVEATRYKTREGVEVIVGRDVGAAPAAALANSKRQPASQATVANPGAAAIGTAAPSGVSYKVPVQDQAERDRDRLTILTAELMTEGRALEQKRSALKSPRASMDLGSDQLQALRDSVERHESNIRALNAEIRQVNLASRGGSSLGSATK